MKKLSVGEETLARDLRAEKVLFEREFRFHPVRRWKFDFVVGNNIAIEVEGGHWVEGRHNRGSSFEKDLEKYNTATLFGWRVFRFTTDMVTRGVAIDTILRALAKDEA